MTTTTEKIEIAPADASLLSDALTSFWHHAPLRRAEVTEFLGRTPGLWIEGDGADEDES